MASPGTADNGTHRLFPSGADATRPRLRGARLAPHYRCRRSSSLLSLAADRRWRPLGTIVETHPVLEALSNDRHHALTLHAFVRLEEELMIPGPLGGRSSLILARGTFHVTQDLVDLAGKMLTPLTFTMSSVRPSTVSIARYGEPHAHLARQSAWVVRAIPMREPSLRSVVMTSSPTRRRPRAHRALIDDSK